MKHIIVLTLIFIVRFEALGQGMVNFNNLSGTGVTGGSPITNALTGERLPQGSTFLVQLYYGSAGASEGHLVSVTIPPSGFASAGLFVAGERTLDAAVIGDCALGARQATLQVRSWQTNLGPTWESALANSCAGSGVLGKSSLFTITTGNPCAMPPGAPANLAGLTGFSLVPCLALYINMQPVSQTVVEGEGAVFSVSAGGPGPYSYQWYFNGMDIAGATSASLTVANAQSTDAGNYTVVVSNSSDSVTSAAATLTVTPHTTRLVTTFNDSGGGSLRDAIAIANSGDLILFAPVVRGKIRLTSGELFINKPLSIVGPGAAQLAVSGNTNGRVFHIGPLGDLDIYGLTITEGRVVGINGVNGDDVFPGEAEPGGPGETARGGGILNEGLLRLYDCMITTNTVQGGGGGAGGNNQSLNFPAARGGLGGGGLGGAVFSGGACEFVRCTILGNTAEGGPGGVGGGPGLGASNRGGGAGGAGGAGGGAGIFAGPSATLLTCTLENCTLAGNRANGGSGGGGGGGSPAGAGGSGGGASGGALRAAEIFLVLLRNCTISDNSVLAGAGGEGGSTGSSVAGGVNASIFDVMNTLIAGNTGNSNSPDIAGMITSLGWNLVGITDGSNGWTTNDFLGNSTFPLNALLGPCQNNGGPVWTMCPLTGSPARDNGQSVLATDARGGKRVVDFSSIPNAPGGNGSDIGALEVDSLFRILSLTRSNTFARVRFKTDAGTFYTLQQTSVVTNRSWTNMVGTVMGDGHALEITDPGPLPPTRFYRVRGE